MTECVPSGTVTPFTERDLTSLDMARHFRIVLQEEAVPPIKTRMVNRRVLPADMDINVLLGGRLPIASRFTIRIVPGVKMSEWMATQTRRDNFTTFIDCCIRIVANREMVDQVIGEFAGATQNWLNQIDNLQYFVRGLPNNIPQNVQVYDSWATEVEPGYAENGAVRVARITHKSWVAVPYRTVGPPGMEGYCCR